MRHIRAHLAGVFLVLLALASQANAQFVFTSLPSERVVGVQAYGAVGDGVANDAAAIQTAINAAGEGGVVVFPKPTAHYFIGATTLIVSDRQQWRGDSAAGAGASNNFGTTIRYTGTGSAVAGAGLAGNTFTQYVRISNLRIIGHTAAQVLDMRGWIFSLVEFVEIDSSNAAGIGVLLGSTAGTGSGGANAYYNELTAVTITNSTGIGIKLLQSGDSGTNDNRIRGGKNVALVGVKFEGSGVGALNAGNLVADVSFENGAAATRAIWIDTGVDNAFMNNRYERPGAGSLDLLFGTTANRNVILGGHFGSSVSGARITDNSTYANGPNGWFAPIRGSTTDIELRARTVSGVSPAAASGQQLSLSEGATLKYFLESVNNDLYINDRTGAGVRTVTHKSGGDMIFGGVAIGAGTLYYTFGGGLRMGNPAGGDKGAGTANFAGDIYKNNSAYTNPDYVFERWATGQIVRFASNEGARDYGGLMPLADVKDYVRHHFTLPRIGALRSRSNGSPGLFSGGDAVLASLEEAYLYIFELEERIHALESAAHPAR